MCSCATQPPWDSNPALADDEELQTRDMSEGSRTEMVRGTAGIKSAARRDGQEEDKNSRCQHHDQMFGNQNERRGQAGQEASKLRQCGYRNRDRFMYAGRSLVSCSPTRLRHVSFTITPRPAPACLHNRACRMSESQTDATNAGGRRRRKRRQRRRAMRSPREERRGGTDCRAVLH